MNQALIILCANDGDLGNVKARGGERDYTVALTEQLQRQNPGMPVYFFKVSQDPQHPFDVNANTTTQSAKRNLPLDATDYKTLRYYTDDAIKQIDSSHTDCIVLGMGDSTSDALVEFTHELRAAGKNTQAGLVAHQLNSKEQLKSLNDQGVTIFVPQSAENLSKLDVTEAADADLVTIDAVPHTYTQESCQENYDRFLQTENGRIIADLLKRGQAVVPVIVNGGYPKDGKHIPYTDKEAKAHGRLLRKVFGNANIVLIHGGPRNLNDESMGHMTIDRMADGYRDSGHVMPVILKERFEKSLPYNATKAALIIAQHNASPGIVVSAEGYAVMDAALNMVDNHTKHLVALPFDALNHEASRLNALATYNQQGIAIATESDRGLPVFDEHPDQPRTPPNKHDPSLQILNHFGLTNRGYTIQPGKPQPL